MRVVKDSPFEFSYLVWKIHPPQNAMVVIVKATFDLVSDDVAVPAKKQTPCGGEQYWDDDPANSLRVDTDHAIFKPRGECFAMGSAHAAGGVPVPMMAVSFRVGAVQRKMVVFGDRVWSGFLSRPSAPEPFVTMPLQYERAFGGRGFDQNPLGRGLHPIETAQGRRVQLPNLEDPDHPISSKEDRPVPSGFFPIPRMWKARVGKAGTYDQKWVETRWPWLAADVDWTYFNSAPPAQQMQGYWKGDESLELRGFHPTRQHVRSKLPGVRARAFVELRKDDTLDFVEVPLQLDTITLDGDALQVQCVWRGRIDIQDDKAADVETLFYFDESLDAESSPAECRARFEAKRDEEAAEEKSFEIDEPSQEEPEEQGTELVPLPDPGPGVPMSTFLKLMPGLTGTIAAMQKDLPADVSLMKLIDTPSPPPVARTPSEIKKELQDAGKEVPDEIASLEDPAVDDAELVPVPPPEATVAMTRESVESQAKPGASFKGMDLSGLDLSHLDLSEVDFSEAILTKTRFSMARLHKTVFDGASLVGADLTECFMKQASFRGADLSEVRAERCNAREAVFDDATGDESVWTGAVLDGASLLKVWMEHAVFTGASLKQCEMEGADFTKGDFTQCDFTGANLQDLSFEKVNADGARMEECKMKSFRASEGASFRGVSFAKSEAPGSQWSDSNLERADLGGVLLDRADFSRAHLVQANFSDASIVGGCFQEALLVGARMIKANVMEGSFEGADLSHADLRGANLFSAQFWRARTEQTQLELANVKRTHLEEQQKS